MTVRELIKKLLECDMDSPVEFCVYMTKKDIETYNLHDPAGMYEVSEPIMEVEECISGKTNVKTVLLS